MDATVEQKQQPTPTDSTLRTTTKKEAGPTKGCLEAQTAGSNSLLGIKNELNSALLKSISTLEGTKNRIFKKKQKDAINYMTFLIDKISILAQILRLKLLSYSDWYDKAQIGIIVLSSLITLSQAIESEIVNLVNSSGNSFIPNISKGQAITSAFTFFVLSSSAGIGITSAVIKFKGWKAKSNNMNSVYNSALYVVEVLDLLREKLKLTETEEEITNLLSSSFLTQQYCLYKKTLTAIRKLLPLESQVNHTPDFFSLNLRSAQQRSNYENSLKEILSDGSTEVEV